MAGVKHINADTDSVKKFARKLRKSNPEIYKALRKKIRQAGNLVKDDARGRTDSVKVQATLRVSASGNTATVRAGNKTTRLPALLEGDGTPGSWDAPNFPPRGSAGQEAFVHGKHKQKRKPYLHPALEAKRDEATRLIVDGVTQAIDDVLRGGG